MSLLAQAAFFLFLALATAFSEPVRVGGDASRGAVQPQLALAPDGTLHVVFGSANAIYHASSKDGRSFGTPTKIAELEKLALGRRRGPRVTATNDVIAVAAISLGTGTLHGWTSSDGGKTWAETEHLNTVPTSAREGLHAMAGNGRGLTALTWLDLRNGKMELWSRVSSDGGRTWAPEVRIYASPEGTICECCHPSVTVSSTGEIAALWRNALGGARDMWTAASTDGGKTFPKPQKLGTGTWKLPGCPMDGGGICFQPGGTVTSVWRRESSVFLAMPGKAESLLAEGAAQPVVVMSGGAPVIAFEKDGSIMVASGAGAARPLGKGVSPSLAANPGAVFIAWESDGGILVDRLR